MAKTKATIRRIPASARWIVWQRTIKPLRIKEMLPQQKATSIKKAQMIKTINVRSKPRYFFGRYRPEFLKNANLYLILILIRIKWMKMHVEFFFIIFHRGMNRWTLNFNLKLIVKTNFLHEFLNCLTNKHEGWTFNENLQQSKYIFSPQHP